MDFHPSGAWLVSASGDGTVRMWDTRTIREREEIGRVREVRRGEIRAEVRARLEQGAAIEAILAALDREAATEEDRALVAKSILLELHAPAEQK